MTKAGELLYAYAVQILGSVHEAKTAITDLSDTCSGELVVGTSDHIGLHRLPPILKSYISSYPDVELKLRCHRSETVFDMVRKNLVDLGIITLPEKTDKLISKTIWKDSLSLVFPKDHPLKRMRNIKLKDTVHYGMILPETGTTTRKLIDALFSRKNLSPRVDMEVAYIETIKVLVMVGLGISILPDKAVDHEIRTGRLVRAEIQDVRFSRNLGIIYLKDKLLSRPAVEFLKFLDTEKTAGAR
jgi:DNA-binding transcriptional LysR family regulator